MRNIKWTCPFCGRKDAQIRERNLRMEFEESIYARDRAKEIDINCCSFAFECDMGCRMRGPKFSYNPEFIARGIYSPYHKDSPEAARKAAIEGIKKLGGKATRKTND